MVNWRPAWVMAVPFQRSSAELNVPAFAVSVTVTFFASEWG